MGARWAGESNSHGRRAQPASYTAAAARAADAGCYGKHRPYNFLRMGGGGGGNECVTYTHGMGKLMGGRGLWDHHGPRVCVV
eukprot:COSAG05_NODE_7_length_42457_cov_58.929152_22_plen_82_part_00